MKSRRVFEVFFWMLFAIQLFGCEDGIIGTGLETKVAGSSQKGPFVLGSLVRINQLTESGEPTLKTILTETKDDLGNFEFTAEDGGLYQISVEGYHFNEILGKVSAGPLQLQAIYRADASAANFTVVNVLTHLINKRILFLINDGLSAFNATEQAQNELTNSLNNTLLLSTDIPDFTQLSVYNLKNTNLIGNAYLLAISATLYQAAMNRSELNGSSIDGELTMLLQAIADDVESDGIISDALTTELSEATRLLNPEEISKNLKKRSDSVNNIELTVPDISIFLDSDGDGVLNDVDTDDDDDGMLDVVDENPYVFEILPNPNQSFVTTVDTELPLVLEFNIPRVRPYSVEITTPPAYGVISGSDTLLTYTPDTGYVGGIKFSYRVNSLDYSSNIVTVLITVN